MLEHVELNDGWRVADAGYTLPIMFVAMIARLVGYLFISTFSPPRESIWILIIIYSPRRVLQHPHRHRQAAVARLVAAQRNGSFLLQSSDTHFCVYKLRTDTTVLFAMTCGVV
jgi:hypothetical protein